MKTNRSSQQAAFTLVEMLVVIIIIALLAGLLLPAVGAARKRVINGRIAIEISNIDKSIEAYKQKYGDYPPNSIDLALLRRHILKAWPHINNAELNEVSNLLLAYLDPAEAIPFWLGGFSSDPNHPFLGLGGPLVQDNSGAFYANTERSEGLYEFDKSRLSLTPSAVVAPGPPPVVGQLSNDPDGQNDSFPFYLPNGSKGPVVYFDSRSYGGAFYPVPPYYPSGPTDLTGVAKPYLSNRARPVTPSSPLGYEWVNENTFQIISAGQDGHFGSYACYGDPSLFPIYPDGANYDPVLSPQPPVLGFPGVGGDNDNITNFSGGGTLEDVKP